MNKTPTPELFDITKAIHDWDSHVNDMRTEVNGQAMPYGFGKMRIAAYQAREQAAIALAHLKTLDKQYELTPDLEKLLLELRMKIGSFIPLLDKKDLDEEVGAYSSEVLIANREVEVLNDIYAYFGFRNYKDLDAQAKLRELNDFNENSS